MRNLLPAYELLDAAKVLKGEIDEGLKSLKTAVQIDLGQSSAITKIADVHLAQGESKKAKEEFLKAIEIAPGNNRARQCLGIFYGQEGNVKLAIEHYEKGVIGTPAEYTAVRSIWLVSTTFRVNSRRRSHLLQGADRPDSKMPRHISYWDMPTSVAGMNPERSQGHRGGSGVGEFLLIRCDSRA